MGSKGNSSQSSEVPLNGVIDPQLGEKLLETDVITALRGLADLAQDKLSNPKSALEPSEIDNQLRAESQGALSSDEQLAMNEVNVLLAKYGQTPANSVEGLIKLRKMLVHTYKDNSLVPAKTRNELAVLERNLAVVEQTRELFITRRITEERAAGNKAYVRSLKSHWDINAAEIELEIQEIEKQSVVESARTHALEVQVGNKTKTGLLRNDNSIVDKIVDNDRLEKTIDAHKKTASILWAKMLGPIFKVSFRIALWVTVAGVLFTLFVELSKTPMYPMLSPFNDLRHFVFDPIWLTISNMITSATAPKS
jgi:hypothetical protein